MTLLNFLRDEIGLKGTKLGCGEGGCGACTVMLSQHNGVIRHISANACLTPVCSLDGCSVTTVEGIGNMRSGLHPIQERLASFHGSQCGFCTPGIVMALYAQLREKPMSTPHELEECLDGNLCRCTGYRPIIDAVRSLSNNKKGCLSEEMDNVVNEEKEYRSAGGCGTDACCSSGESKSPPSSGCCGGGGDEGGCPCMEVGVQTSTSEEVVNNNSNLDEFAKLKGSSEPIFPPDLMNYTYDSVKMEKDGFTWYQPASLSELLSLKSKHTAAKLVVGNTEVGIETKFKNLVYPIIINPSKVPELKAMTVTSLEGHAPSKGRMGLSVGAAVTINAFRECIQMMQLAATKDVKINMASMTSVFRFGEEYQSFALQPHMLRSLEAIKHQFTWFASNQIRNVACVAGNVVTASPIGDLNPMLMSSNAVATLVKKEEASMSRKEKFIVRHVMLKDFFLSYRKVDMKPDEILQSIWIPFTEEFEYVIPLKQARRREDDISIVTGGFRAKLAMDTTKGYWFVEDMHYAMGGMAPTPISATRLNTEFLGKEWNEALFEQGFEMIKQDFTLPENVPGGQAEYRSTLAASFIFRAFLSVTSQLQQSILDLGSSSNGGEIPPLPVIDSRTLSASEGFVTKDKPESRGQQNFYVSEGHLQTAQEEKLHGDTSEVPTSATVDKQKERAPIGQPIAHKSARLQVSGEATYTNDIAMPSNTLYAALVMSSKPHAELVDVDVSDAEKMPGFHSYMDKKDVTGHNRIGAVFKDEEVFADGNVRYVGMVIGVVLADSHEQAVAASKKVKVVYNDLPHVVSIEEAIDANSFYPTRHVIESGDIATGRSESEVTVSGRHRVGQQEHFYLETNATVALPTEHGHLEVTASTQNCSKTQQECAAVTGLDMSKVVVKCKRMGGGFGGKEERSIFITVTAALAAHVTGRPISILIERDVDMAISGQRHSFVFDYQAGMKRDGTLTFLDATLYSNAGWSLDLSQAVMDRALFHSDNVYKFPNQRVEGVLAKTNQPSHTAFRGFGGPQGMMLTEFVLQHLSKRANMSIDTIREKNFYHDGDRTHFGQMLEGFHIPRIWDSIQTSADIAQRKEAISEFNSQHKYKKRGICTLPTKFGINFTAKFLNQGGALVHVYTDGTVLISHGGTEMGQGLFTKVIQVAAQCFGISHTMINCLETATTSVANSSPTAASMSTDLYGMAVLNACEQIRARLVGLTSECLSEAHNQWSDDVWRSIVNRAYFGRINLSAQGFYAVPHDRCGYDWEMQGASGDENAQRGMPFNYFTQGVACAEVEIDCLTGDSHVIRADVVMDIGKSINPALDIGQIEGAFTQGFGWATMEEYVWGDTNHPWVRPGHLFTKGPGTYKIPAFNDVPRDMRIHLYDTANRFCVHSSKAVGEPPFFMGTSVYFAIWDAVYAARQEHDKLSYYPLQSPATSERIRMACADNISEKFINGEPSNFQPKGSY
jgi:xanthine dehydrogenase/oxidase